MVLLDTSFVATNKARDEFPSNISVFCHKKHGSKLSEVSLKISSGGILIMLKNPGPTSKISSPFRLTNAQMQAQWIGRCVASNSSLFKSLDLTVDYI